MGCTGGLSKASLVEGSSMSSCVEDSSMGCTGGLSKASLVEVCSTDGIESSSMECFSEG